MTSKVAFLILPVSVRKAFSIAENNICLEIAGCLLHVMGLVDIQSRKISISCDLVIWICWFRFFPLTPRVDCRGSRVPHDMSC